MAHPQRGEIWTADFDPIRGHEQGGQRPALVVSADTFNAGPAGLVVVLPLTTKSKGVRSHVAVDPPEGGLTARSFIKCEDVRSISLARLSRQWGTVTAATLTAVEDRLRILLDL
jgi:mRNA interferase MazF